MIFPHLNTCIQEEQWEWYNDTLSDVSTDDSDDDYDDDDGVVEETSDSSEVDHPVESKALHLPGFRRRTLPNTMELARSELSRIVGYQNPYSWSIDSHSRSSTYGNRDDDVHVKEAFDDHQYYFLDQEGCNTHGDSALHRLLALHASPCVIQNFVDHMKEHRRRLDKMMQQRQQQQEEEQPDKTKKNTSERRDGGRKGGNSSDAILMGRYWDLPHPPSIDQVNYKGVSALHVVLYRNSWHVYDIAKLLLQECPALATMAMRPCGSYPLHVLMGHCVTLPKQHVLDLLLQQPDGGNMVWKEDKGCNNPLSLLWQNVLRFRWARRWEEDDVAPPPSFMRNGSKQQTKGSIRGRGGDLSWMTVISPCQFMDYSLAMLQAAYRRNHLTWHDICGFPRCPPLLVRVVLLCQQLDKRPPIWPCNNNGSVYPQVGIMVEGSIFAKDEHGRLALHRAADSPAVININLPLSLRQGQITSLVELLLLQQQYKQPIGVQHHNQDSAAAIASEAAAAVLDDMGRFPLHYACFKQSVRTVARLIVAYPEALRASDPMTGSHSSKFQISNGSHL